MRGIAPRLTTIGMVACGLLAVSPLPSRATSNPVVVIVMENEQYSNIVGNANAPFINKTMIAAGVLETQYTAIQSGSLPNYLAMTSGTLSPDKSVPNLFQALGTGIPWTEFEESMPSACYTGSSFGTVPGSSDALYTYAHNPAIRYTNIKTAPALCNNTVPLDSSFDPNNLPAFSYVVPNQCNDTHTTPTAPCPMWNGSTNPIPSLSPAQIRISMGDHWLSQFVPLVASKATVILTWDESNGSPTPAEHIATVEYGLGVSHGAVTNGMDGTAYTHYGLEAGLYSYFGLGPAPGAGATATRLPIGYPGAPPPTPTISSVSSGYVGQQVTITGTGLTGASVVDFGAKAAQFTVTDDSHITATVPCSTSGSVSVTVTTPGGTSSPSAFSPSGLPKPTVNSNFSPLSGPSGTSVAISGSALGCATAVSFNGIGASFTPPTSDTKITATVPSGATTGPISVSNATGTGTSSGSFMVTGPSISRVGPVGISPATATAASESITVGAAGVPAGDTVALGIVAQAAPSITSVVDSKGNNYTVNVSNQYTGSGKCTAALASSKITTALAQGDTITVTISSSGQAWGFVAEDWRGLSAADVNAKANSASTAGTAVSVGPTPTTTAANEAVFGLVCAAGAPGISAGVGYSNLTVQKFSTSTASRQLGLESNIVSATGAQTAKFTLGSGANWAASIGTYK